MHQKKRKIFVLYSIPIWIRKMLHRTSPKLNLCNKEKLYLVSYSIPLSCMVVLLLTGIFAINPSLSLKTSAVTIQDEWVVKDNSSTDTSENNKEGLNTNSNTETSDPNNMPTQDINDANKSNNSNNANSNSNSDIDNNLSSDSTAQNTNEGKDNSSDSDQGIMPLWVSADGDSTQPSISITVTAGTGGNGGGVDQVVNAFQGGGTVYRSHNVTVQGTMLKDYSLVLTGPTNLTMPSGASSSTSTVSGAGGKTGSNLTTNTWGYAWGNATDTDSDMTYNSLSSSGTTISDNSTNSIASDKSLNFTKKLVFAAKFGDVAPGNYTANVTLSAVATPIMTMSSISNMQDMTANICTASSDGQTATLTDSRDSNSYVIYKASDSQCWMGENLRLTGSRTLTPSDSDVTSNWTLPASGSGVLAGDNTSVDVRTGSTSLSGWKNGYGNYYSWCAATANTCQVGGTPIAFNVDAASSICPKGWKLPANSGTGSFQNLYNAYHSSWSTGQTINGTSGMSGYYFGYNSTSLIKGANFWPAAGYFYIYGFDGVGSDGRYWSRTAGSTTSTYYLGFRSSNVDPTSNFNRYFGLSVRCVAVQ